MAYYDYSKTKLKQEDKLEVPFQSSSIYKLPINELSHDPIDDEINQLTDHEKESLIIEDLLSILIGFDGEYLYIEKAIDFKQSHEEIDYDLRLDISNSQLELLSRITPTARHYNSISKFCHLFSSHEFGYVNHALVASIKEMLKEYTVLINQLEYEHRNNVGFTLQKFWFYFHPSIKTLKLIRTLILTFYNIPDLTWDMFFKTQVPYQIKGGFVLDIIFDHFRKHKGDDDASELYEYLFTLSSKPYLKIINSWIYEGIINDFYQEFFIAEKEKIGFEESLEFYWESKFVVQNEKVPRFLCNHIDMLLSAGKLINVIKTCNVDFVPLKPLLNIEELDPSVPISPQQYFNEIQRAYHHSNQEFIKLIFDKLIKQLRCFKRYFFLEQSDFFTHFLDLASEDLIKPARIVSTTKIQSLFDLSLRNPSSVTYNDPFKDKLEILFTHTKLIDLINNISLNDQSEQHGTPKMEGNVLEQEMEPPLPMSGIEAFSIKCQTEFPVFLAITKNDTHHYQIIFRNLMLLKHVEQLLGNSFIEHTKFRRLIASSKHDPVANPWQAQIHTLQNRMLNFIQSLLYYISFEVLEPNYQQLEVKLHHCTTLEQIHKEHINFLKTCFLQSTLLNSKLYGIINKIVRSCLRFIQFTKKVNKLDVPERRDVDPASSIDVYKYLSHFEYHFLYHVKLLLDGLHYYAALGNPCYLSLALKIDFNNYYNDLELSINPPSSASSLSIPNSPLFADHSF
ncbi:hypothetical protein K502DRAFT_307113 [Neoconidiobolus thromboides FSU 785]|nr:hypothetical protein K502DRAFT_307113 [Neoconidiobolus thromboides FSU 785]